MGSYFKLEGAFLPAPLIFGRSNLRNVTGIFYYFSTMTRKGGGPIGEAVNLGLWGTAYANSDGSVTGTVKNRFTYSLYIFGALLGVILIGALIWFVFGQKSFKPQSVTPKESFKNKKVKDRPMFKQFT